MSDFHEPVNIGNPREMTIKQFAEEIIRITGTKSKIEYKPLPVDDPKVRQPDIDAREKDSRLGTEGAVRGRNSQDDRLFPGTIGAGRGNAGSLEISVVRRTFDHDPLVIPSEVEESLTTQKAIVYEKRCLDSTRHDR